MLASAMNRDDRKAMGCTVLILLVLSAGLPVLAAYLNATHRIATDTPAFLWACPPFSLALAFDRMFGRLPKDFWYAVTTIDLLSWSFIVLSSRIVTHAWQDKAASPRTARWRERRLLWSFGDSAERKNFRARLLAVNPILWLAGRNRLKYALVWAFLGICGVLWFWASLKHREYWLNVATYIFTAVALHTLLKLWLVSEACRCFAEGRSNGALELLLSTPLTVKEILTGQLLALKRQFGGPICLVILIDVILLFAARSDVSSRDRTFMGLLFGAGIVIFLADMIALSWVGMWQSLTRKRVNRAVSGTFAQVLFLPWVIFGAVMTTLIILEETTRTWRVLTKLSRKGWDEGFVLGLWFAIALVTCLGFGISAYRKLHREFRDRVVQRFSAEKRPFDWWRLWRNT